MGEATKIQPNTNNSRALHLAGVIFLPSNITAKAAVEKILSCGTKELYRQEMKRIEISVVEGGME